MKKMGLLKNDNIMGKYEIEQGYASYATLMKYYVNDMVLCNNIINIDSSVYDNMCNGFYEDEDGEIIYKDIYQYYICNLNKYDLEKLNNAGVITSYSDLLECNIICVDHFGTNWDCVPTDVKIFDNYEDLKKYENSIEEVNERGIN